ncbi:hypothetical protein FOVG_10894 [Fusarium oxysporum f. sp. pisi HDV247]|uniref:Uncharacterized protein n=2 Tax=Fusarium oxysporum f. sp. pisi HDV247 TaxID=1080344 RepID=W9P8E9_FUSOX|nr:hypothetical protein FOVG_10894 [Fusarium oxysporum f. sp. pisi HDV247]
MPLCLIPSHPCCLDTFHFDSLIRYSINFTSTHHSTHNVLRQPRNSHLSSLRPPRRRTTRRNITLPHRLRQIRLTRNWHRSQRRMRCMQRCKRAEEPNDREAKPGFQQVTHQSSNAALFNPPSHLGIQALSRAKWHCLQLGSYGMVIPVRKPELIQ